MPRPHLICLASLAGLLGSAGCVVGGREKPTHRVPFAPAQIAASRDGVFAVDVTYDGHYLEATLHNRSPQTFDRVWLRLTFVDGTNATERKLRVVPDVDLPLFVPGKTHFLTTILDDPELVARELIDADLELVALPTAATDYAVVRRELWDPRPARPVGVPAYPRQQPDPFDWLVVHHSAFAVPEGPLGISHFHREARGFADIAYQFVIDEAGQIYAGRDLRLMGAHAGESLESNQGVTRGRRAGDHAAVLAARQLDPDWGSLGVVLDGFFFYGDEPTAVQLGALRWLAEDLRQRYAIPAEHVIGHLEVAERITLGRGLTPAGRETTCPGPGLQPFVEQLRRDLGAAPPVAPGEEADQGGDAAEREGEG